MTTSIRVLFFLIKENKVILCESNLKDFVKRLPDNLADIRTYDYFYRNFRKSNYFQFEFNREYFLQKVEYDK